MKKAPRITIGIPVFNGERFVACAIESMLNQTFRDFELIITDNASTDRTQEICRYLASKDSRIQYHRADANRGIVKNFNWPVELARGELFHWHAADDSAAPTLLEKCVAILDADPSVVLAFARTMMIDENDTPLRRYNFDVDADHDSAAVRFARVINLNPRHHCGQEVYGVIRLSELRKTPLYEPNVRTDSILLARLALLGKFRAVDEPLFLNREHGDRSVHLTTARSRLSRYIGSGPIPPAEFWNPVLARKINFPEWKILQQYSRSIHFAPAGERNSCRMALAGFALKHFHKFARDVLIAVEHAILGHPQSHPGRNFLAFSRAARLRSRHPWLWEEKIMMSKEARRKACIAASLAVAWNAIPSVVRGDNSAPDGSIAYTHFSWSSTVLGVRLIGLTSLTYIDYLVGDVPAGETFRSVSLGSGSGGGDFPFDRYAFVGLGSGTLVMISFADGSVATGRDFQQVFGFPEADAYQMIQAGGSAMQPIVDKLLGSGYTCSWTSSARALTFSTGTDIGEATASFAPIPEPTSAIVCLGALGLCTLRRYRPAVAA